MLEKRGLLKHHPLEGTLFAGCQARKLGLATYEVTLPEPDMLLLVKTPWPTHTVMVIETGPQTRHIVSYGPPGRPHVSPACPWEASILRPLRAS